MQILYYYRKIDHRTATQNHPSNPLVQEPSESRVRDFIRPLGLAFDESMSGGYQITMLYVSRLRDSDAMNSDQIRRLRTAIREETKERT